MSLYSNLGECVGKILLVRLSVWRNAADHILLMTHKDPVSAIDLCQSTGHRDILENSVTPMLGTECVCHVPTPQLPSIFRRRREVPPIRRSAYHHECMNQNRFRNIISGRPHEKERTIETHRSLSLTAASYRPSHHPPAH